MCNEDGTSLEYTWFSHQIPLTKQAMNHFIQSLGIPAHKKIKSTVRYLKASTISLSFWLSWFLDMISEANMTIGHEFESQPLLI